MSAYDLLADAAGNAACAALGWRDPDSAWALRTPRADRSQTVADSIRAALDLLGFGVLLADSAAKVLAANRAADTLLKGADGLRSYRGRLRCDAPRQTRALHDAIRAAAGPAHNPDRSAFHIGVTRSVVRRPLTVHVVPLAPASADGHRPRGGVAAVFLVDPTGGAGDVEGVARAYRLTPSEARVVAHVVAGRGLVEAAAQLRIAMPTVRTHLQHVFAKTGTGSQAELVGLVAKSSVPLWPAEG